MNKQEKNKIMMKKKHKKILKTKQIVVKRK